MFNWRKDKGKATELPPVAVEPRGGPLIAALLLNTLDLDVAAARHAIGAGKIAGIPPNNVRIDKGILNCSLNDEMRFVAPMGAPYPWSDLEGPCHTSWMWPKDKPAMNVKGHKSHVLVTALNGSADAIARRLVFTHAVSRVASLPGVVGVFWPEATLVHYPPVFIKMAAIATPEKLPFYLWVDFRVLQNESRTFTCFTTGLAPLGLMEMEITGLSMPPGELRTWAINIAAYMHSRGSPIPDGDTIGATATEQLRVTYGPSGFGAKGTVMRLGIDSVGPLRSSDGSLSEAVNGNVADRFADPSKQPEDRSHCSGVEGH